MGPVRKKHKFSDIRLFLIQMLFGIKSKNNHISENYTFQTFLGRFAPLTKRRKSVNFQNFQRTDKKSHTCFNEYILHNYKQKINLPFVADSKFNILNLKLFELRITAYITQENTFVMKQILESIFIFAFNNVIFISLHIILQTFFHMLY